MDAIAAAVEKGVMVARATHSVSGRVVLEDEINDKELGTIVSDQDIQSAESACTADAGTREYKRQSKTSGIFFWNTNAENTPESIVT